MSRSVPEWIGKTDDTPVPMRVKLRVFERDNGICHIANRKIVAGEEWDAEHVIAIINGGENRESNLAPALRKFHPIKTAEDVAIKSRNYRKRTKYLGLKKASRGFYDKSKFKAKIGGGLVDRRTGLPASFNKGVRNVGRTDR